jgi:putative phage-type endonuclease
MLTVHNKLEQRSDAWYAARRGIVTASMVGQLVTPTLRVADNDTSRGVTAGLVAERITGVTETGFINDDMWRGIEMEPHARDVYSGHYQQAVECGFMRRDEAGWTLGYSPDGLVAEDGLVEIKCPRAKGHVATIVRGEVPAYYMAQCQAALLVSGRQWIDYVSFHAGLPLFVKRVLPDPAWHDAIVAACRKFETTAAEQVAAYEQATTGLAPTERVLEMEMSL